jgi:hypothetical protein
MLARVLCEYTCVHEYPNFCARGIGPKPIREFWAMYPGGDRPLYAVSVPSPFSSP